MDLAEMVDLLEEALKYDQTRIHSSDWEGRCGGLSIFLKMFNSGV